MNMQILLLICACFFCSCQIKQKAQTNDISNQIFVNTQAEISSNNNSEKIEKKPVDISRFASVKTERTDQEDKFSLKIDVEYPQLKKARTPQEIRFNQYVKKQVDEQIKDFKDFLVNEKMKEVKVKNKLEFEINLDYTVDYFSDKFTSVVMNWNGYSGYLNMDYFPSTINFDLKKGQKIELRDIFEPDSKYLNELSELAIAKLKRTCLSCGCGDNIHSGDPLPEGKENDGNTGGMFDLNEAVSAKEENFHNWSITVEGLRITFDEYQVAPGCAGIIKIVIPFDDLQPILRKDLKFNQKD